MEPQRDSSSYSPKRNIANSYRTADKYPENVSREDSSDKHVTERKYIVRLEFVRTYNGIYGQGDHINLDDYTVALIYSDGSFKAVTRECRYNLGSEEVVIGGIVLKPNDGNPEHYTFTGHDPEDLVAFYTTIEGRELMATTPLKYGLDKPYAFWFIHRELITTNVGQEPINIEGAYISYSGTITKSAVCISLVNNTVYVIYGVRGEFTAYPRLDHFLGRDSEIIYKPSNSTMNSYNFSPAGSYYEVTGNNDLGIRYNVTYAGSNEFTVHDLSLIVNSNDFKIFYNDKEAYRLYMRS